MSVWQELDVAATTDIRAIRSAYARRLKSIDVDNDPDAFIRLRGALEAALRLAALPEPSEPPTFERPETPASTERGRPDWAERAPPPMVDHAPRRILEDQMRRLELGLSGDVGQPSVRQDLESLAGDILAAAPVLSIDHGARLEHWWATLLQRTAPASDFLIEPVATHFGWTEKAKDWRTPPAILAALSRRADARFRDEISSPAHRWSAAWRRLKAPPPWLPFESEQLRVRMRDLLRTITSDHPALLPELNQKSVARLSGRKTANVRRPLRPSARLVFSGLWMGFILVSIAIGSLRHPPGSTSPAPVLSEAQPGLPGNCSWQDGVGPQRPYLRCLISDRLDPVYFPSELGPKSVTEAARPGGGFDLGAASGWFYAVGGPPELRDRDRGAALLRQAADAGTVSAMYWLGVVNAQPDRRGITYLSEARRWLDAAKARGFAPAFYSTGLLYVHGVGGAMNVQAAVSDFREAAARGYAPAMAYLAYLYECEPARRRGDSRTPQQLIREAAATGDPDGLFLKGQQPLLRRFYPSDVARALPDLNVAAGKGSTAAMTTLAVLTIKGVANVAERPRELLLRAAKLGNAEAMYDLGLLYANGKYAPRDLQIAGRWLSRSANAGFIKAQTAEVELAKGAPTFNLSAGCSLSCEVRT